MEDALSGFQYWSTTFSCLVREEGGKEGGREGEVGVDGVGGREAQTMP